MLCRKCRFLLFYTHSVAGAPLCVCVCVCAAISFRFSKRLSAFVLFTFQHAFASACLDCHLISYVMTVRQTIRQQQRQLQQGQRGLLPQPENVL